MLLFIAGYMHSGTTLLLKALGKHSQIHSLPAETRFIELLEQYRQQYNLQEENQKKAFVKRVQSSILVGTNLAKNQQLLPEHVRLRFEQAEKHAVETDLRAETHSQIFQLLAEHHAAEADKAIALEKTPSNIFFLKKISHTWPDAKIIVITRDIRQVLLSKKIRTETVGSGRYKEGQLAYKKLEKDYSFFLDGYSWKTGVRELMANASHPNLISITYESLVAAPEAQLTTICHFLGLTYENHMLDVGNRNAADPSKAGNKAGSGIQSDAISNWQQKLSKAQIAFLQRFCQQELQYLNYPIIQISFSHRIAGLWYYILAPFDLARRAWKRSRLLSRANFWRRMKNYLGRP
ncbi:MAG TPA: sulfotransferase [Saprospiraceae bacterium]|nr:sulfotransferase [Saprospiraceae bacterium]HMQ83912.1 sulfotransferase [Saprospiraceae bacterium]